MFGRRKRQHSEQPEQPAPAKSPVSLTKGQVVSLTKEDGTSLEGIRMGLGWDPAKGVGDIDLDANCTAIDANGDEVFTVSFGNLVSYCLSVRHTGDNLTGKGKGDDESILVDLLRLLQLHLDRPIAALYFTVNSFRGQPFSQVANASCHIVATVDGQDRQDLGTFNLSKAGGKHTALIMARVVLHHTSWYAEMIGQKANGRVASDLLATVQVHWRTHPVRA